MGGKNKIGNRKRRFRVSLPVFCLLFFILIGFPFSHLNAANPKRKLTEIQKQLTEKKQRVREARKKEKSILSRIENINKNIKRKQKELQYYDKRISQAMLNIAHLSKEIHSLNAKSLKSREYLKKRLRTLYKQQEGGNALILLSARDYQDLIRKSRYISLIAYHDSRVMKTYGKKIDEINFKKTKMESLYKKLERNKTGALKKKKELQAERIKKDKLLAMIKSKRSTYEKTIKELEVSSKKLREMIKRLAKKNIPASVSGKGFRAMRGHLSWPVNGRVLIPFGKYRDPKFNIPVFKNGVEIRAKPGDRPKAVSGGRVVYADWFRGYGLLLIINHGSGYHSLYGNLSEIFHRTGDIIRKGEAVGTIGKSRLLNVPSLYFEIRYKGKPVNPLLWLKEKGRKRGR